MKKAVFLRIVLTAAVLALLLSGCRFVQVEEEERKPVDYTVVERRDIPEELSRLMEEKKEKEFQLSYETGEDLYLAKGYDILTEFFTAQAAAVIAAQVSYPISSPFTKGISQ